jgi:group I intron endonuclease
MRIHRALLGYGYESFSLHILEYCKLEDLIKREQYYLDTLRPEYNICKTAGSTLGKLHTEETRVKIGATKSGTGKGADNSMFGQFHTAEAIRKTSEAKIGKKLSEETKAKLSAAAKGKNFTEEHIKNLSAAQPNSKRLSVLDLETGAETTCNSIGEAARTFNLLLDSIRANMRSKNKKPYKGRYVFKTID